MKKNAAKKKPTKAQRRSGVRTRPASDKRPGKPRFMSSQRENFCRLIALRGYTATEACREAYNWSVTTKDRTIQTTASQLRNDPEVVARIEELQAPVLKKAALSLEEHLGELGLVGEEARRLGQMGPAVAAVHYRGEASGLYTKKIDATSGGKPLQPQVLIVQFVGPDGKAAKVKR